MAQEFTTFVFYRCEVLENDDPSVIYKALPTLVRLTKKEHSPEVRILAADTLAFLIETSPDLQRVAAISNHLIPTVASFLWWDHSLENHALPGDLMTSLSDLHPPRLRMDLPSKRPSEAGSLSRSGNLGKE